MRVGYVHRARDASDGHRAWVRSGVGQAPITMSGLLQIDSILFFVSDLDASANFYEGVLGLKRVWTDNKREMIGFVFPQSESEIVIHNDSTIPTAEISFLVEKVEEFCQEFRNKGYKILQEPVEIRCGKYAVLADLDDNRIPIVDLTKFGGKPKYD